MGIHTAGILSHRASNAEWSKTDPFLTQVAMILLFTPTCWWIVVVDNLNIYALDVLLRGPIYKHYNDVIMRTMASQLTGVSIVCSTVGSGADQRKHQSSASLVFVWGIHRWPVNSPNKGLGPVLLTATWRCRKNFSQWECSFHWKLRCHWLEFLRQRQIAVVRHGPVTRKMFPSDDVIMKQFVIVCSTV